jgi:hypothetical protein
VTVTSFLDRIGSLERIGEQAQQINVARVLLTLLSIPFVLIGVVGRLLMFALVWCAAAAITGWQDTGKAFARGPAG